MLVLCDLERSGRDAVTLGTGAQTVPLFHRGALGAHEPPPVRGFLQASGELANHDATNKIVAALHVVPVN